MIHVLEDWSRQKGWRFPGSHPNLCLFSPLPWHWGVFKRCWFPNVRWPPFPHATSHPSSHSSLWVALNIYWINTEEKLKPQRWVTHSHNCCSELYQVSESLWLSGLAVHCGIWATCEFGHVRRKKQWHQREKQRGSKLESFCPLFLWRLKKTFGSIRLSLVHVGRSVCTSKHVCMTWVCRGGAGLSGLPLKDSFGKNSTIHWTKRWYMCVCECLCKSVCVNSWGNNSKNKREEKWESQVTRRVTERTEPDGLNLETDTKDDTSWNFLSFLKTRQGEKRRDPKRSLLLSDPSYQRVLLRPPFPASFPPSLPSPPLPIPCEQQPDDWTSLCLRSARALVLFSRHALFSTVQLLVAAFLNDVVSLSSARRLTRKSVTLSLGECY